MAENVMAYEDVPRIYWHLYLWQGNGHYLTIEIMTVVLICFDLHDTTKGRYVIFSPQKYLMKMPWSTVPIVYHGKFGALVKHNNQRCINWFANFTWTHLRTLSRFCPPKSIEKNPWNVSMFLAIDYFKFDFKFKKIDVMAPNQFI